MGGSKKLRAKASKAAAATAGSGAGNLTRPPDSSSDVARWGTVDMRDAEDKCRRPRAGWVRHCGGSATCRLVPPPPPPPLSQRPANLLLQRAGQQYRLR